MKSLSHVCFLFLLLGLSGVISAQSSNGNFLAKYPVKSAIVQYNFKSYIGNDTLSHPYSRETFDAYGAFQLIERIDGLTIQLYGEPYQQLFKDGYKYSLNDPIGCATKFKIKDFDYTKEIDKTLAVGFSKAVQDLIHKKINKSNQKNFISFTKTGDTLFLERKCSVYEYIESNPAYLSKNKNIYIVYQDICLSEKTFFLGNLIGKFEATSLEENVTIAASTFEVPQKYRMIDGDKLELKNKEVASGFNTLIVNYITKIDYYQTKGEGKKTLYSKDQGKKSVWEREETTSEYNLAPVFEHSRKIWKDRTEFLIDYIHKTVHMQELNMTNNYNYKTIAELNYLFENKLYDNTVKVLGQISFLGKDCTVYEIKTGIEKLEVYEWKGVFLKTKKYICTDGNICNEYQLYGEETATSVQENVPVLDSLFDYPSDFIYSTD